MEGEQAAAQPQPLLPGPAWKERVLTPPRWPASCARCRSSSPSVLHSCTQPWALEDSPEAHSPPSTCWQGGPGRRVC